jgi:hypothetical protein
MREVGAGNQTWAQRMSTKDDFCMTLTFRTPKEAEGD